MDKKFNIHDWQAKQRRLVEQDDDPNFQKRQDRLTPGKNPDAFYGPGSPYQKLKQKSGDKSQESMSNADIRSLQTVVGEYSLNKVLNTIAVIADRIGKHDEADMVQKLADKIQDFDSTEDNQINEQFDPRRPKDREFDTAQAMSKLTPDDRDKLGKIQQMMRGERKEYEKVTFVYTEQGGHFYGLDVYVSKDQNQRSDKLGYDDANEWLKNTLDLGLDMDMIPRRYGSGMERLDDIVEKLEDLGIEASHHDFMDVS